MNAYQAQMAKAESGEPASLSERAFRLLRQQILNGAIQPGSKLKMDVLQREYSFSSSPLREALNRLAAEGLVIMDENRGFRAATISEDDFHDVTTMRLLVEPAALASSIGAATEDWEARIVTAFHRLKRIEERVPRPETWFDDDWTARHKNFHMALISQCPSQRLFMQCWNLFDQAERYRRLCAIKRRKARNTKGEHKALMEAALARDADLAADLIRQHVQRTSEDVQAFVLAEAN
jgi:GntR family carbon starvation induced transcriptional regulator